MIQRSATPVRPEVLYPCSDDEPMAESDLHWEETAEYVVPVLKAYFADRPQVYVASDNFIYWDEGDPRAMVSPDAYVIFGVEKRQRQVYKLWEEGGRAPSFVLEVSSASSRKKDLGEKLVTYRDLGVLDYFIYDPLAEWLPERLRGFHLVGGEYERIAPDAATGRLPSRAIGLDLAVVDEHLRYFEPGHADPLPTPVERAAQESARAAQEAARAEREAARAETAEAEVARLRAELARLRGTGGGA